MTKAQSASNDFAQAEGYLRRLKEDEAFALEELIVIKNKQAQPVPLKWWRGQRKFNQHRSRVNAAMKIRQQGFTVGELGRHVKNARLATFFPEMQNRQVDIYNKSDEDSTKMFGHIKFIDDHLPEAFREAKHDKSSAKAIHYKDSGWQIRVMTAGKTEKAALEKGRGSTPQELYITETGYIENAGTLVGSALGSLPDDGSITMESTSSGPRGWFSKYCLGIMQNGREIDENVWAWEDRRFMFFGFLEFEDYSKEAPGNFKDEDEEEERLLNLGADPGKIMWRRSKLADYGSAQTATSLSPVLQFKRDYPATWQDAFEEAGGAFFNHKIMVAVKTIVKETWPQPLVIGLQKAAGERPKHVIPTTGNRFTLYKLPVPGWAGRYIFFSDVGQGRPDGDLDVGYVGDLLTREVVAKFDGRLGADVNAESSLRLCSYFYDAALGMDMSGVGAEARPYLLASTFTNLWCRYKVDNYHIEQDAIGIVWNRSNRASAVGRMRNAVDGREWVNPDPEFHAESEFFGYHDADSIKPEAATGFKDDHCMAYAGLLFMADRMGAPSQVVAAQPYQDVNKLSLQRQLAALRRAQKDDIGTRIAKGFNG